MKRLALVLAFLAAPLLGQTPTPTVTPTRTPTVTPTATITPTPTRTPIPIGPPRYALATQVKPGFGTPLTEGTVNKLGDIYYAADYRTFARLPGNTSSTQKFLCQTGTGSMSAAPYWCTAGAGGVTGSGTTNQVPYWTSSSALGGSANFTFDGSTWTLGHASSPAVTTTLDFPSFSYATGSELRISGSAMNLNMLRLMNTYNPASGSEGSYSALAFADRSGVEHGAIGFANTGGFVPYTGYDYLETWSGALSGTTVPVAFRLIQSGYMNGSWDRFVRMEVDTTGSVFFNDLDANSGGSYTGTRRFTIDGLNGRAGVGPSSCGIYRNTNAGADATPRFFACPNIAVGGTGRFSIDFDESSSTTSFTGLNWSVNNTSSHIVRYANILGSATNRTAGTEAGQLDIQTSTGGAAPTSRAIIDSSGISVTGNVKVSGLGASLSVCTDGSKVLTTSGCSSGGSGTVTSIATTAPITGGTITTTGTIGITSFATTAPSPGAVPDATSAGAGSYLNKSGGWTVPSGTGATSPLTTKGDVWVYSSGDTRQAVGADGKILTADSTVTNGVSYKGGMVQIGRVVASGSSATVTFSSIPAWFSDLLVIFVARDTKTANSQSFAFQMNGDTTAGNYQGGRYENVDSGGVTSGGPLTTGTTGILGCDFPAASSPANAFGQGQILYSNYANTGIYKRVSWTAEIPNGTAGTGEGLRRASGYWKSTAAITSITYTTNGTNFASGTVFTLYGLGAP